MRRRRGRAERDSDIAFENCRKLEMGCVTLFGKTKLNKTKPEKNSGLTRITSISWSDTHSIILVLNSQVK